MLSSATKRTFSAAKRRVDRRGNRQDTMNAITRESDTILKAIKDVHYNHNRRKRWRNKMGRGCLHQEEVDWPRMWFAL